MNKNQRKEPVWSSRFRGVWHEQKGLLLFVVLMVVFRSSIADWNDVPTSSMRPTIIEGDRVLINKVAYDVQLPLINRSIYRFADPQRGDIIIFNSDAAGKRLIKRVVGVPGDKVQLIANRLRINNRPLEYRYRGTDRESPVFLEIAGTRERLIKPGSEHSPGAYFTEQTVPDEHYLVLGDNRGNSADSRYIGFVPRDEVIGRSRRVVISVDKERYYLPRKNRVWENLDPS